jgi:hypothetical protein
MKKLFTVLVASICGTMAYAQTDAFSVNDVTISKGGSSEMEVVINNATSNTAFQFDLKLPAKVSVKNADMKGSYGDSRVLMYQQVDASNNIYRFLSYDNENATLASDGDGVIITLEAEVEAESGKASLNGDEQNLVVDPTGVSTSQAAGDIASINIEETIDIVISEKSETHATTYVGDDDLDFTGNENLTAYLVTGIDEDGLWLARVNQVPAGTPIYVKATEAGTFPVVKAASLPKMYYKSFMIANNTDGAVTVTPEANYQYMSLGTKGWSKFTDAKSVGAHKAYICAEVLPEAKAGADLSVKIGSAEKTTICVDVDLDFTDQTELKAYAVMGYEDGALWLSPVTRASAGTPLYLKGPQKDSYTIKSTAVQAVYSNMLVGNNTDESITIQPTDGEYTNLFLGSNGFSTFNDPRTTGAHKSYLQVLTSYITSATVRGLKEGIILEEKVAELSRGLIVGEDDSTTGISRFAAEAGNDTWYNLSGQRIDKPTKKGLYIKNGKKVILK